MTESPLVRRLGNPGGLGAVPKPSITRLKIVTLGSAGSGKSTMVKRFCGEAFQRKYNPTVGVDYGVRAIGSVSEFNDVRLAFFDLSGDDNYSPIRLEFYKDADAAVAVFDATTPEGPAPLHDFIDEARRGGLASDTPVLVVASKCAAARQAPGGAARLASHRTAASVISPNFVEVDCAADDVTPLAKAVMTLVADALARTYRAA